jgi:ATP-dependent exoDNAse (exonuclease V) beta subunit
VEQPLAVAASERSRQPQQRLASQHNLQQGSAVAALEHSRQPQQGLVSLPSKPQALASLHSLPLRSDSLLLALDKALASQHRRALAVLAAHLVHMARPSLPLVSKSQQWALAARLLGNSSTLRPQGLALAAHPFGTPPSQVFNPRLAVHPLASHLPSLFLELLGR